MDIVFDSQFVSGGLLFGSQTVSGDSAVTVSPAWVESPDVISASLQAGSSVSAAAGWVESPDIVVLSLSIAASVYARAPAGEGYHPRAGAHQNRPPALQGYYE